MWPKCIIVCSNDPISTGGGGGIHPPSGFSSITQKREILFSSNLATFSLIRGSQLALSNLRIDLSMLPW